MRTTIMVTMIFFIAVSGCNQHNENGESLTMENKIKSNVNAYLDSCWNAGNTNAVSVVATDDVSRYLNGIRVAGTRNEMEANMTVFLTAFPDLNIAYDSLYINGTKVFMKWHSTGTNTGRFGELPATGKKVKIEGLSHLYFNEDGKMYQEDVFYNELNLLQQLGYSLNPPIVE